MSQPCVGCDAGSQRRINTDVMCNGKMRFKQYDVVRVVKVNITDTQCTGPDQRPPRIGDIAAVLEVYDSPPGYELECCDSDGITIWLGGYSPEQLGLEIVQETT